MGTIIIAGFTACRFSNNTDFIGKRTEKEKLEKVLERNLRLGREEEVESWCQKCKKYGTLKEKMRKVDKLAEVLVLNLNVSTDKDREFLQNQQAVSRQKTTTSFPRGHFSPMSN